MISSIKVYMKMMIQEEKMKEEKDEKKCEKQDEEEKEEEEEKEKEKEEEEEEDEEDEEKIFTTYQAVPSTTALEMENVSLPLLLNITKSYQNFNISLKLRQNNF